VCERYTNIARYVCYHRQVASPSRIQKVQNKHSGRTSCAHSVRHRGFSLIRNTHSHRTTLCIC
jgi:hypothetical protein